MATKDKSAITLSYNPRTNGKIVMGTMSCCGMAEAYGVERFENPLEWAGELVWKVHHVKNGLGFLVTWRSRNKERDKMCTACIDALHELELFDIYELPPGTNPNSGNVLKTVMLFKTASHDEAQAKVLQGLSWPGKPGRKPAFSHST